MLRCDRVRCVSFNVSRTIIIGDERFCMGFMTSPSQQIADRASGTFDLLMQRREQATYVRCVERFPMREARQMHKEVHALACACQFKMCVFEMCADVVGQRMQLGEQRGRFVVRCEVHAG